MRIALIVVVVVCLGIGLAWSTWSFRPGKLLPSSFFHQLDTNHDKAVALSEWQRYYGLGNAWASYEWEFRFMDCDDDLRLTWKEYRAGRFRHQSCGKSMDPASRPQMPGVTSRSCVTDPVTQIRTCCVTDGATQIRACTAGNSSSIESDWFSVDARPKQRLETP